MTDHTESIVVGLGEMRVLKNQPAVLTCLGLGSCIALCAYDPLAKVAGMSHMVLPSVNDGVGRAASPKYVDTAVPILVQEMTKQGAVKSNMVVKIAGGAQVLRIQGVNGRLNVGERNLQATKVALAREGISIAAADVGGDAGRTMQFFAGSGKVFVRPVGGLGIQL